MKITVGALMVVAGLFFVLPPKANSTNIEWLGILTGTGGMERETGMPGSTGSDSPNSGQTNDHPKTGQSVGLGSVQALAVIPLAGPIGAQASFQYTGGSGSRFATTFGPIYDFTAGKVGLFASYQHRTTRSANFWWIEPALDWYLDQLNLSLRYIQPLSSAQKTNLPDPFPTLDPIERKVIDQPINRLQATASYFPPDFLTLGKDNLELTLGAQVNTFGGPYQKVGRSGVGPVFGVALMPMQNVEFTLIKGTVDNRSRYDFQSGIKIFFGKSMPSVSPASSPSLKELRRKYMEASPYPVSSYTGQRRNPLY